MHNYYERYFEALEEEKDTTREIPSRGFKSNIVFIVIFSKMQVFFYMNPSDRAFTSRNYVYRTPITHNWHL